MMTSPFFKSQILAALLVITLPLQPVYASCGQLFVNSYDQLEFIEKTGVAKFKLTEDQKNRILSHPNPEYVAQKLGARMKEIFEAKEASAFLQYSVSIASFVVLIIELFLQTDRRIGWGNEIANLKNRAETETGLQKEDTLVEIFEIVSKSAEDGSLILPVELTGGGIFAIGLVFALLAGRTRLKNQISRAGKLEYASNVAWLINQMDPSTTIRPQFSNGVVTLLEKALEIPITQKGAVVGYSEANRIEIENALKRLKSL